MSSLARLDYGAKRRTLYANRKRRSHSGIEARHIQGFRHIDLLRRDSGDEVEFTTLMWFDSLDCVRAFMGDDYSLSHVPAPARAVLSRFDERAAHFDVLDRRPQS